MNLNDYLVKISSIPRLTAEEERALHKRSRHDQIAKEQFIESNLWLVVKYAHKYASNGNLADLISEGSIGLMRAAERYDPGRGYRFGTYGAWHIKSFIIRYLKTDEITRLPHDMQTIEKRMKQAIGDHVKKKGYEPDNSYLSKHSKKLLGKKYKKKEIDEFKTIFYSTKTISYDNPVRPHSEATLLDFLSHDPQSELIDSISGQDISRLIKDHLETVKLDETERSILLDKLFSGKSFKDISDELGINKVRERYDKSIRKLRKSLIKSYGENVFRLQGD